MNTAVESGAVSTWMQIVHCYILHRLYIRFCRTSIRGPLARAVSNRIIEPIEMTIIFTIDLYPILYSFVYVINNYTVYRYHWLYTEIFFLRNFATLKIKLDAAVFMAHVGGVIEARPTFS